MHGLFFLGSTGEVVFHDEATRRAILEHAVRVVDGRVPVLAGVVDPTTDRMIGHARTAAAIGADAVVVTAPFYTRTSQPEIVDHFRYVAEDADVPVIAYDIPVCVHVKLERATIATLAREGTIAGLKDSSGDLGNFRAVLADTADVSGFFVMTGGELDVDAALLMGAHGCVPGLGNVDPAGYVRLWNHARNGDWEQARREQERLCRLFGIIRPGLPRASVGAAGVGGFKTALRAMGVIAGNTMARPQRSLNDAEAVEVTEVLRSVGMMPVAAVAA